MKRDWVTTLWMGPCWNPKQGYCVAGLAWPVFLACHSLFSRDLPIDIMPCPSPDNWEGQEVNQTAHGKNNHFLLAVVLIKANGCKRFSEVLLLCHDRG